MTILFVYQNKIQKLAKSLLTILLRIHAHNYPSPQLMIAMTNTKKKTKPRIKSFQNFK